MPRVLIVDDESTPRVLLGKHFADAGYSVSFAGNGWEALLTMRTNAFDLILCDLTMPGMGALPFVAAMREEQKAHAPPVIVFTGPGDDVGELVGLDVQAVLMKGQERLDEALRTANELLGRAGE